MPVAVNINNQRIKVVSAENLKISRWETVELTPGLVKDGQILQPEALAKILQGIFEQTGMARDNLRVCVTGMSFVYRILGLPKMKKASLREAIERATQREINVSLNDLYIDWQVISEKADSLEVFVLGAPRIMVDAVVRTFKLANLKLSLLDINPLALARLVNQPKALIADFGQDWFDIVIVSDGLPVTLHSVATKGNFRELEDSLTQLNEEIRRTVDFFNLTHKENLIKPGQAVFLSGINKTGTDIGEVMEKYIPEAVAAPNGHMQYPGSFIPADYAVLLGLIIKNQKVKIAQPAGNPFYRDIEINLLAGRNRALRTPVSLRQVLMPAGIIVAIVLLTPLMLLRNAARTDIAVLNNQLTEVNRELRIRRIILSQEISAETQIAKYLSDTQMVRDERASLAGPGNLAASLNIIQAGLSGGLSYSSLVSTPTEIIIEGRADNRTAVLDFTSYLEKREQFPEVRIASIEDMPASNGETGPNALEAVVFRLIVSRKTN
jgi:Tfp pilus assembly PilM family ATPase